MKLSQHLKIAIIGTILSSCYSEYRDQSKRSIPVKINASVMGKGSNFGLLTGLNEVNISIDGCISGFSAAGNIMQGLEINMTQNDSGCVAKIVSFNLGGDIYELQSGQVFNPNQGSISLFSNSLGANIYVMVLSQLSSPISDFAENVSFAIVTLEEGTPLYINNVAYPVVSFMETTFSVAEGVDSTLTIPLAFTGEWQGDMSVNLEITGTASAGFDYESVVTPLVIPAGTTQYMLNITLNDDSLVEAMETIQLSILPGLSYVPGGSSAQVEISDNDENTLTDFAFATFDEAGIQSSNGLVTSWTDGVQTAYQSNQSQQPSFSSNYFLDIDAVNFDGIDDILIIDSSKDFGQGSPKSEKMIVFVIESGADISSAQVIFEQGGDRRGLNIYIKDSKVYAGIFDSTKKFSTFFSADIFSSTLYYLKFVYDQTNDLTYFSVNGTIVGSSSGLIVMFSQGDATAIGGVNAKTRIHDGTVISNAYFSGMIFEGQFFNGAMDSAFHAELDTYIFERYGNSITP